MKKIISFLQIVIFVIYALIVLNLIIAVIAYGFHNIHMSAMILLFCSIVSIAFMFAKHDNVAFYIMFTIVCAFKTGCTLFYELLLDIILNGFNYADDGMQFILVLLYLILVSLLFIAEAAFAVVNIVSLYKEKDEKSV